MPEESRHQLAVIGAGQLGSRHIQALCKAAFPARIWVVDPSAEALSTATLRAQEMEPEKHHQKLSFHQHMAELPETLDLAVVATLSRVRLEALRELLEHSRPANLLLEKVVFLSELSWRIAAELIADRQLRAWVNCPRRMNPAYRRLRDTLGGVGPVRLEIAGTNYGLAGNAIHFIDLAAFLTGEDDYEFDPSELDRHLLPSKRSGYIEVSGRLKCRFAGGHSLAMSCRHEPGAAVAFDLQIEAPGLQLVINEIQGAVTVRRDDRGILAGFSYAQLRQSDLTNLVAEDILAHRGCPLTSFAESMRLHLPMLAGLAQFHAEITGTPIIEVPIT